VDPYEAAEEIEALSESLLDAPEVGLADLIKMANLLDNANRNIRAATSAVKTRAALEMEDQGEQRVVLDDGIVAERTGNWKRVDIDREALVKFVDHAAQREDLRIDKATGAMRSSDEVALDLHKRCFRPEPRWTELKKVGVDEDEYCRREWQASIKIITARRV